MSNAWHAFLFFVVVSCFLLPCANVGDVALPLLLAFDVFVLLLCYALFVSTSSFQPLRC